MADENAATKTRRSRRIVWIISLVVVVALLAMMFKKDSGQMPELQLTDAETQEAVAATRTMTIRAREGFVGPIKIGMTPEEVQAQLGESDARRDDPEYHQTTLEYQKLGLHLTFDTGGVELRAIICMSNSRETPFSQRYKPAVAFAGATSEGIAIGASFEDVKSTYGAPGISQLYFPRNGQPPHPDDIIEHAYLEVSDDKYVLMILVKNNRVVEMHICHPTWTNPPLPADSEFLQHGGEGRGR